MKAAVTCLLVLLLTATNIADAREYRLRVYCGACRDIAEHPVDARNFGINQLYGARSWLNFDQADRFVDDDVAVVGIARDCDDVASECFFDVLTVVGVHQQHAADLFLLVLHRVQNRALGELA